jgi:DNA-binding transcriptional LysR family regulator
MDLPERVSQRLKLRDLRLLLSVVQWGSMAKAATQLNLTQSGVSRAIADMEHTLGVRLFDRTSQGVEPTLYGHALRKWGNAIFDDLRQGVKEIEFLADPTAGELRIGCAEPMLSGLLPAIIGPLHQQYPRIEFHVTGLSTSPQQYRELRERNVDLILGRMLQPLDEDLEAQTLFEERTFVVAGLQNRWARRRRFYRGRVQGLSRQAHQHKKGQADTRDDSARDGAAVGIQAQPGQTERMDRERRRRSGAVEGPHGAEHKNS